MNTRSWLEKLVGFDTTSRHSNLALIETVRDALAQQGLKVELFHSAQGDKANLFATLPADDGPAAGGWRVCVAPRCARLGGACVSFANSRSAKGGEGVAGRGRVAAP